MKFTLTLPAPWRHGRRRYQPGLYRVPEDMTDEVAELAIQQAGAVKHETPAFSVPVTEIAEVESRSFDGEEIAEMQPGEEVLPKRRKRAPKNKSLNAAPDNKSEMD